MHIADVLNQEAPFVLPGHMVWVVRTSQGGGFVPRFNEKNIGPSGEFQEFGRWQPDPTEIGGTDYFPLYNKNIPLYVYKFHQDRHEELGILKGSDLKRIDTLYTSDVAMSYMERTLFVEQGRKNIQVPYENCFLSPRVGDIKQLFMSDGYFSPEKDVDVEPFRWDD